MVAAVTAGATVTRSRVVVTQAGVSDSAGAAAAA
jgi:hypothetical protein